MVALKPVRLWLLFELVKLIPRKFWYVNTVFSNLSPQYLKYTKPIQYLWQCIQFQDNIYDIAYKFKTILMINTYHQCVHCLRSILFMLWVRFMVFNATFNNISVISQRSVLLVGETGVPGKHHRPTASHGQTLSHNVASSTSRLSAFLLWIQNNYCSSFIVGGINFGRKTESEFFIDIWIRGFDKLNHNLSC
jgi:hypothetical protein